MKQYLVVYRPATGLEYLKREVMWAYSVADVHNKLSGKTQEIKSVTEI